MASILEVCGYKQTDGADIIVDGHGTHVGDKCKVHPALLHSPVQATGWMFVVYSSSAPNYLCYEIA